MAFDSKFPNYGVIKVEGNSVLIYYSSSNYDRIPCGDPVSSASWAGDHVIVNYVSGKIRRYSSTSNYDNV